MKQSHKDSLILFATITFQLHHLFFFLQLFLFNCVQAIIFIHYGVKNQGICKTWKKLWTRLLRTWPKVTEEQCSIAPHYCFYLKNCFIILRTFPACVQASIHHIPIRSIKKWVSGSKIWHLRFNQRGQLLWIPSKSIFDIFSGSWSWISFLARIFLFNSKEINKKRYETLVQLLWQNKRTSEVVWLCAMQLTAPCNKEAGINSAKRWLIKGRTLD